MKLCSQGLFFFVIFAETIKGDLDSRYQKCDKPLLINGKVRLTRRGRIARFKCNPPFQLLGEKYATCLRGQWDTNPICVKPGCVPLPTFKNGQKMDTYRGAVFKFICNPGYSMIGSSQIYCDGSIWNGSLPQCSAYSRSAPTKCDFESPYICGWTQDPFHVFNWSRQNYQTPSRNIGTGPSFDHTLGPEKSGYYMFIETSSPRIENDTARLFSPVFSPELTVSQPSCFIFWYHMFGATTGILNVYVKPEDTAFDGTLSPKFTKSGNQGDEWFQGIVQLPRMNMAFQVIVEALRGSSYVSDIAIDDVKITNGSECIAATTVMTTTEPPFQNTSSYSITSSARIIGHGRANFTFSTLPSPFSSLEIGKDTETSEYLTSHIPTDTYRMMNSTQVPNMTTYNPQHQLEVYSTTEKSKRIPIPAESTPLIIQPPTTTIKITMGTTTPTITKIISIFRSSTVAVNQTTAAQNTTIPTTTAAAATTATRRRTAATTTATTPKATTTISTTKFVMTMKPTFSPIQRFTPKHPTTQSIKNSTPKITTRQITRKPSTTPTTTTIKPNVPLIFPELQTTAISTMKISYTEEPIQEKIITIDVKVEPDLTTEKTDVPENPGKGTRGKEWIKARIGPIPERKKSLSVSSIAGILVAVTLVITAVTIAGYLYIKHRKRALRQSCIADDSDVRFLTSDEVLDFSIARPSDSGEDDL